MISRLIALVVAVLCLGVGGLAVAQRFVPQSVGAKKTRPIVARIASQFDGGESIKNARTAGAVTLPSYVTWGSLAVGALALGVAFRRRKRGGSAAEDPVLDAPREDRRVAKKTSKRAAAMARSGQTVEAAELCFQSGLLDAAAGYFEQAESFTRAAEIRHDQNRFIESAELYVRADQHETAGTVFAQQGETLRAAQCFVEAERYSVAAEMFEKAEEWAEAGKWYMECEFFRHAAQVFIKAKDWSNAAKALEQVVHEEGGAGLAAGASGELAKIVMHAAKLYERASDLDGALRVLQLGRLHSPAGEVAMRLEQFEVAADHFRHAGNSEGAAEALRGMGDEEQAQRIMGEHWRDRGDDETAAQCFLDAGEWSAAGDLFRKLENYPQAAECYEKDGESEQAAEMFRLSGDLSLAAANYERAGRYSEASECWKEHGDPKRQAELLAKAGRHLAAAELFKQQDDIDSAVQALQQVARESDDYGAAAALLGEIFQDRGETGLAIAKLGEALDDRAIDAGTVDAYYRLARLHEAQGDASEARALYERLLAYDYNYADVEARLAPLTAEPEPTPEPSSSAPLPSIEESAARYRIDGELGRGGMGIVYQATDTVLDRTVAFKVLPDAVRENPQAVANFLREAKSAAKLNHPNIVTVYDAGEQDGRFYIAMEYVAGTTLRELLRRRGPISSNGVLHLLLQLCQALAYAHENKVVHRDIKTANIMWTREKKAKIMDFGLARVVEEVRNHTTVISGTPFYMSPEQTLGRNIDHRTDLYSLGVSLFELCTGQLPFSEGNIPYHHVHTPAPDPRTKNHALPTLLVAIISRCLQKDPSDRYQSAREILDEIRTAYDSAQESGA